MDEFAFGESIALLSMLRAMLHQHPQRESIVSVFTAISEEEVAHALATSPSEARIAGLRSMSTRLLAALPDAQLPRARPAQ